MRPILLLVTSLAATGLAAPINGILNDVYGFTSDLAEFYSRVSKHIGDLKRIGDSSPTCDISKATLPPLASGLPAPPAGQKLLHVAVGRGTQNYTCTHSLPDVKPVAVGALATLYNASCLAANYPDLIAIAPDVAINIPLPPDPSTPFPPANLELLGHHYFSDATTPIFNLDTTPEHQYGIAISKKKAQMDAPANAVKGENGVGDGAVAWLYLETIDGTVGGYKSVYRVNTAGGQPPESCANMPSSFTVQYAADYYFYGE